MAGLGEKALDDRKVDLWNAWHIAALARAKKLPKLEKLVGIEQKSDPKTLADDLKATLRGYKGRKIKS